MAEANQITCPRCGQSYSVHPHQWPQYDGRTITCTRCANPFTVVAPPRAIGSPPTAPFPQFQTPSNPLGAMPYAGRGMYLAPKPASVWAMASLVGSIVLFLVPILGGLFAIAAAIRGLVETREGRNTGRGLAVAGLAIGLLGLVIAPAIETPLVVSAISRSREQAKRHSCASNLKSLGASLLAYAKAHDDEFPANLKDLAQSPPPPVAADFICPDDDKTPPAETPLAAMAADLASGQHCSYVYVGDGVKTSDNRETVLMYEPLGNHHREGMNVLFVDGRVEWLDAEQAQVILDRKAKGTRPMRRTAGG